MYITILTPGLDSVVLSFEISAVLLLLLSLLLVLVVFTHIVTSHQCMLIVDGQIRRVETRNSVYRRFVKFQCFAQ